MSLLTPNSTSIDLQTGPIWRSFDQFRSDGATSLGSVKDGKVATLYTKTGQYRIIEEQDFQKLLGLASDVARLRGGLRLVMQAVRVVQEHPDSASLEMLATSVTMVGNLPELPTRSHFDHLSPEDEGVDPDDEVTLDPDQIERPLSNNYAGAFGSNVR